MDFWKELGDAIERAARSHFVIGAVGAAVSSSPRFLPGASWVERAWNVGTGAVAATYLTTPLTGWLGLGGAGMGDGAAFVVGAFGMSLMAALTQAIKETPLGSIVTSWLSRK